jgi:hypothetical protein
MKKILVVDDRQVNRDSAKLLCNEYEVVVFESFSFARKSLYRISNLYAVMSDLFMPAKHWSKSKEREIVREEIPIGWSIPMTAALLGVPYVVLASDENYHGHPLEDSRTWSRKFQIKSSKYSFKKRRFIETISTALFTTQLRLIDVNGDKGKDWKDLLERVTAE